MKLVLALLVAVSGVLNDNVSGPPVEPSTAIDASCYGSNFRIGTGNVPFGNNDRATTVVNIWAAVPAGSKPAVAWIAKTENGAFWIQTNRTMERYVTEAFPAQTAQVLLATKSATSEKSLPRQMTSFSEYTSNLEKVSVIRPCFTHDLPAEYTGTAKPMTWPGGKPTPTP